MDTIETFNMDFIDQQYRLWKTDPNTVSREWQFFFKGFEIAGDHAPAGPTAADPAQALKQAKVEALKYRYRDIGHLLACMDPLGACPTEHPLLSLGAFGLSNADLNESYFTRRFSQNKYAPLKEIIQNLRETYCRSIGVEYMHIQDPEERRWLQDRMEPGRNRANLTSQARIRILEKLNRSALFEKFLNKKYIGVTRFSLEGGDAIIPLMDELVNHSAEAGCHEIILGMAHRGRLNVQAHILQKPYDEIFSEFESCYDPEDLVGAGDVKYHNGYLAELTTRQESTLRVYLVNNPSHLEAVDPVVEGVAYARQTLLQDSEQRMVMPLLIHGDAAFAGQGVVAETLNMSQLEGYKTGGTIHIVINNQIGYTTLPEDARSTRYSTDIAKMLMVPIFHIHGENPEALIHVIRLAVDYRMTFNKDVVLDVICYRRYGHNEGDEPYFTQPQMYDRIRSRQPLNRIYGDQLVEEKIISKSDLRSVQDAINKELNEAYDGIHGSACPFPELRYFENWDGFYGRYSHEPVNTGVDKATLIELARKLDRVPDNFNLYAKLERLLKKRLDAVEKGGGIDWGNAEILAFATILAEGHPVRLSGQDSARGTFSHRHSVLIDTGSGDRYTPLNAISDQQARYTVYNSPLAETSVMGFEYGYAMVQPEGLTMWEAQFGDFANNAQSVIDLFVASGETKWQRQNGLVLLLPHGMEGLGPEHSSARLERFLVLCADDNMQVCNATTPAQYFHLLRRQVLRKFRKPLVVMTPKSLLRHPLAVSNLDDLTGGHFQEVIDEVDPVGSVQRVIFCSGKIYYALYQRRQELQADNIAIIRIEQLYPFPEQPLQTIIQAHEGVKRWIWVQEEHENMGAWTFMRPRLEALIGSAPEYIGRSPSPSPATGFPAIYHQEQSAIVEKALDATVPGPEGEVS